MRHGKKHNHLGRTTSHRKAMLANMASSLIEHKRITTTLAKAKALRVYVEPILTKAKSDNTHSRRTVFSYLQSKDAVIELFRDIAVKIADRPGGYTRIIKMENRMGDNAEMALIELVDYNTIYGKDVAAVPAKKATRRRGGAGAGKAAATTTDAAAATAEVTPADDAAVVENATIVEETPATTTPAATKVTTPTVATTEETPSAEEASAKEDEAEKGE